MKIEHGNRLFPLHRYKSLFVKLLIFASVDILILSALMVWFKANAHISVFRAATPLFLIAINFGLAIVCRFAAPKFYLIFLINSVIIVVLFCLTLYLFGQAQQVVMKP